MIIIYYNISILLDISQYRDIWYKDIKKVPHKRWKAVQRFDDAYVTGF